MIHRRVPRALEPIWAGFVGPDKSRLPARRRATLKAIAMARRPIIPGSGRRGLFQYTVAGEIAAQPSERNPAVTAQPAPEFGSDLNYLGAATTVAATLVEVKPGGMRELHWHRDAGE